jgi:hypothetical protein
MFLVPVEWVSTFQNCTAAQMSLILIWMCPVCAEFIALCPNCLRPMPRFYDNGQLRKSCSRACSHRIRDLGPVRRRIRKIWDGMKRRCNNPADGDYDRWGARGIRVCEEWLDYETFEKWSLANGYASTLQIDRIDVNGHYEPGNCRWTTSLQQGRNRRNTVSITAFGVTKTVKEWAEDPRCQINYTTLWARLYRDGVPTEEAVKAALVPRKHRRLGGVSHGANL